MSIKMLNYAWDFPCDRVSDKLLLLALCDSANDHGHSHESTFQSVGYLCKKTGLSDRAVQQSLMALEGKGAIKIERRSGRSNLVFVTGNPRTDFTPEDISPPKNMHKTPEDISGHPRRDFGHNHNLTIHNPKLSTKNKKVDLDTWIQNRKNEGLMSSESTDSVWKTSETLGLPAEFVKLAWQYLLTTYSKEHDGDGSKKYSDWSLVLNNAVKKRWGNLWFLDNSTGQYTLTQSGLQLQKLMEANHD